MKTRAEKANEQALRQREREAVSDFDVSERRSLKRASDEFLSRLRKQEEDKQMADRLGDAPIEAEYKEKMNRLAQAIDQLFNGTERPKKTGFVLMVFPFEGHEGRCNYISNADRKDIVIMLKEQIKRFEGQPDMTGHA